MTSELPLGTQTTQLGCFGCSAGPKPAEPQTADCQVSWRHFPPNLPASFVRGCHGSQEVKSVGVVSSDLSNWGGQIRDPHFRADLQQTTAVV